MRTFLESNLSWPGRQGLSRPRATRAVALIVTVLFLTMVTLMVVALAISVRVGLQTARTHSQMLEVRQLAEGATDCALAMLRNAAPPLSATQTWVLAPGMAWRCDAGVWTQLPLYSVAAPIYGVTNFYPNTSEILTSHGLNINEQLGITGASDQYYFWIATNGYSYIGVTNYASHLVATNFYTQRFGVPILAGWVNVGRDGRPSGYYGPGKLNYATYSSTNINALVARWAVWIDAENCKVNLNTAGLRNPAALNSSSTDEIDLRALDAPFATITSTQLASLAAQPLSTPEEFRRFAGSWSGSTTNDFVQNKFYLTVHGTDQNVDAFGRARIDINSLSSVPLDVSTFAPLNDPLWASSLYSDIITDTNRNTILGKYGRFGVGQILANIIEYRSDRLTGPVMSARDADGIPMRFCGLKKGPMINAIIVHVATNAVDGGTNLAVHAYIDVKLVNGYNDARGFGWALEIVPDSMVVECSGATVSSPVSNNLAAQTYVLTKSVSANGYGLLSVTDTNSPLWIAPLVPLANYSLILTNVLATNAPPVVSRVTLKLKRVRLLREGNQDDKIVDWAAPVDFSNQVSQGFIFDSTSPGSIVSDPPRFDGNPTNNFAPLALVKQDPRVRTFPGLMVVGTDTFAGGVINQMWENWVLYPYVSGTNQYRVVPDGNDFAYDSRLSPLIYKLLADTRAHPGAGSVPSQKYLFDDIAETNFQSVGELANIHTGYPWRTIRFRSVVPHTTNTANLAEADFALTNGLYAGIGDPNAGYEGVEANAAPDWLLLDMFTANSNATVAGRININGNIHGERLYMPHYVSSPSGSTGLGNFVATTNSVPPRLAPVRALLANTATNLGPSSAWLDTVAADILERVFVADSPYASPGRPPVYLTPGEICEVEHLDYFSDSAPANKNQRQQLLRRISELITTRSHTFTIWTTAQIVKERNQGIPGSSVGAVAQEPDGLFDWVWLRPIGGWTDGDGQRDVDGNNFSQDFIVAQIRVQTVVQRYVYEDPPGQKRVGFRTLYTRFWTD